MCYILSNQQLCETFDLLDVDRDGRLSRGEIAALLRIINVEPTRIELDFIFQEMDENRTGSINKEEFVRYMSTPPAHRTSIAELELQFRQHDSDGDGAITLDEMFEILKKTVQLSDRDVIQQMFQATDTNNDGRISFSEFINMMKEAD